MYMTLCTTVFVLEDLRDSTTFTVPSSAPLSGQVYSLVCEIENGLNLFVGEELSISRQYKSKNKHFPNLTERS